MAAPLDIHVWFHATASLDDNAIADALSVLSDEERAQYRRFHFARDARDYAAAHALLRHTLSRYDQRPPALWRFEKTAAGKPFLVDEAVRASFSLSHTAGMVACAVTNEADVGVDVECIDRDVDTAEIAARFFAPSEASDLMELDEEGRRSRFFDCWTLKEALVKALGTGLAASLDRLAFAIGPDGAIRLDSPDVEPRAWAFGLFAPSPRHRLAVAVRQSPAHPRRLIFQSIAHVG